MSQCVRGKGRTLTVCIPSPDVVKQLPLTLYFSRTPHNFIMLTQQKVFLGPLVVLNRFLLSGHRASIASVYPLPFLIPTCASLKYGSTMYLVLCFSIFVYILPAWLNSKLPLYKVYSLFLPFFSHTGTITATCQSLGTLFSSQAFWKILVSHWIPISLLVAIASVVHHPLLLLYFSDLSSVPVCLQTITENS